MPLKLSDKRKQAIYNAIHDEITRLRTLHLSKVLITQDDFDLRLAQAVDKIYDRIKKELNIS